MKKFITGVTMAIIVLAIAITSQAAHHEKKEHKGEGKSMATSKAICVLTATAGNKVSGVITFMKTAEGTLIEAEISGLEPNSKHGFHIHQYGDISSSDGKSTGGHYNPAGHDHSGPDSEMRHIGDLGNLKANDKGVAKYKRLDKVVKLRGKSGIIGRGITVHAGTDDLKTQPTGAAGARIAVGVIGVANTSK